jgi:[protein-PII] uridylyltransferase
MRGVAQRPVLIDVRYLPHMAGTGQLQTIVEVYAPDSFGLLYTLASEISAFGLNVVFAKIASRVDGVVDSFYVVENDGNAFTDTQQRSALRKRLLERIAEQVS